MNAAALLVANRDSCVRPVASSFRRLLLTAGDSYEIK